MARSIKSNSYIKTKTFKFISYKCTKKSLVNNSIYGYDNIKYRTSTVELSFKYGSNSRFARSFRGSSKSSTYIGFGTNDNLHRTNNNKFPYSYADYVKEGRL